MKRNTLIGISVLVVLLLSGLGVGLYFIFRSKNDSSGSAAAIATKECAQASVDILQKGGSAVDAAITAVLCQGVTVPQSAGLGGGLIATIYIRESQTIETINAREVAPLASYKDMYPNNLSSREGGLAVAVPTELKGLHEMHKKYGKLKWSELVDPVAEIAENGFEVTGYLAGIFVERADKINSYPKFKEFFTNPETKQFYKEGEILKNPKLGKTLRVISEEGADAFYSPSGTFTQKLVDEIRENGGIITLDDLTTYQPKWGKPVESKLFNGQTLYTYPLPATGNLIAYILNILSNYKLQDHPLEHHNEDKLYYHRLIESFKFAFAKRSKLGDEMTDEVVATLKELESLEYAESIRQLIDDEKTFNDYRHYGANTTNLEDHGTGHISIMAPNGDAVSITSTINGVMGAYLFSESTGLIFNNEMNDFSIPTAVSDGLLPAPANFIAPKKSPISSMSPIIVLDENKDVSLVIGGAGGILILTSIVQVLINYLFFNQSLQASINTLRLHHQLQPMRIRYEKGFDENILKFLAQRNHTLDEYPDIVTGFAAVVAIAKNNGKIEAGVDPRRGGAYKIVY